jgi:hypothetical protein
MKRKHDNENGCFFTELPVDIILHICSQIEDVETLRAIKITCKKIARITNRNYNFSNDAVIRFKKDPRFMRTYMRVKDNVELARKPAVHVAVMTTHHENDTINYLWKFNVMEPEVKDFTLIITEMCALFRSNCTTFNIDVKFIRNSDGLMEADVTVGDLYWPFEQQEADEEINVEVTKMDSTSVFWADEKVILLSISVHARFEFNKKLPQQRRMFFLKK